MPHPRARIRHVVADCLLGKTQAGDRVYPMRYQPLKGEELMPLIYVDTMSETAERPRVSGFYGYEQYVNLTVEIAAIVRVQPDWPDALDDVCLTIQSLMPDPFNDVEGLQEFTYTGTAIEWQKEGETPLAIAVLSYTAKYTLQDLSAVAADELANLEIVDINYDLAPADGRIDAHDQIDFRETP
jgi:hypothetical protein